MPYDFPCFASPPHVSTSHCSVCQQQESEQTIQSQWSGASEPEIMYWLFFSAAAVNDWSTYLRRWSPSLDYAAVFIHHRPYVRFNPLHSTLINPGVTSTGRCELGDLLVVFTDQPARRRVAALFQAKMAGRGWPPTSPNPDQWELYTTWPRISYNPNAPKSTPVRRYRTVPFSVSNDPDAQYLAFTSPFPANVQASEAITTAAYSRWDQTVNRDLNGGAGRDFAFQRPSSSGSAGNEWDELIWDLLDYTWYTLNPVAAATTGARTPDRGVGTLLDASGAHDETHGSGPGGAPPRGEEDGWGIPVIHIVNDRRDR